MKLRHIREQPVCCLESPMCKTPCSYNKLHIQTKILALWVAAWSHRMRQKGNTWVSCIHLSAQQDKETFLFPLVTSLVVSSGIWPGRWTSESQMTPRNSNGHLVIAKCLLCSTVELIVLLPILSAILLVLLSNPCYSMACPHFKYWDYSLW